jgi:hypothetical protein
LIDTRDFGQSRSAIGAIVRPIQFNLSNLSSHRPYGQTGQTVKYRVTFPHFHKKEAFPFPLRSSSDPQCFFHLAWADRGKLFHWPSILEGS